MALGKHWPHRIKSDFIGHLNMSYSEGCCWDAAVPQNTSGWLGTWRGQWLGARAQRPVAQKLRGNLTPAVWASDVCVSLLRFWCHARRIVRAAFPRLRWQLSKREWQMGSVARCSCNEEIYLAVCTALICLGRLCIAAIRGAPNSWKSHS